MGKMTVTRQEDPPCCSESTVFASWMASALRLLIESEGDDEGYVGWPAASGRRRLGRDGLKSGVRKGSSTSWAPPGYSVTRYGRGRGRRGSFDSGNTVEVTR